MSDLTKLQTSIDKTVTAIGSANTVLAEISDALRAGPSDQAAIDALADKLDAARGTLVQEARAVDITPETPVDGD